MGRYFTCEFCGETGKGNYDCNCHEENYKFIVESRNGGRIRQTFLARENGEHIIYEQIMIEKENNTQEYLYIAIYVSTGNDSNRDLVIKTIDGETFEDAKINGIR